MIVEVRMLGNGAVIMLDEKGNRNTTNVFADHVKALVNAGAVNPDTKLYIPYLSEPITVEQWFDEDRGAEETPALVVDVKQITIFDIIKEKEDS